MRRIYPFYPFLIALCMTLLVMIALVSPGCQTAGGIGDGKVDAVEDATIRVAVGLAMTAAPETVAPAYVVANALLARMDGSEIATLDALNDALHAEVGKLNLTPAEQASFFELASLVRAHIVQELNMPEFDAQWKLVVIRPVIQIVAEAAAARL